MADDEAGQPEGLKVDCDDKITLENFDPTEKQLRLDTPRSRKALKSLGIEPNDLLEKPLSFFKRSKDPKKARAFFEKKRARLVKDAIGARRKIKTSSSSPKTNNMQSKHEVTMKKQEMMYVKRKRAYAIKMEDALHKQKLVAQTEEAVKRAAANHAALLDIDGKKERNKRKDEKARKIKLKKEREKQAAYGKLQEEDARIQAQLDALEHKKKEEEEQFRIAGEKKAMRHDEIEEQLVRQKAYNRDMKEIAETRRLRRLQDEEEERKMGEEEQKFQKELENEDLMKRKLRLEKQRAFKNQEKEKRREINSKRVDENKELERKLMQQAKEQERQIKMQLKKEKQEFVEKCTKVRNYGVKQVQEQMQIINMFKKKQDATLSASYAGGMTSRNKYKVAAAIAQKKAQTSRSHSSPKKGSGELVLLPPLPSASESFDGGSTFLTSEPAPLSPTPPSGPSPTACT